MHKHFYSNHNCYRNESMTKKFENKQTALLQRLIIRGKCTLPHRMWGCSICLTYTHTYMHNTTHAADCFNESCHYSCEDMGRPVSPHPIFSPFTIQLAREMRMFYNHEFVINFQLKLLIKSIYGPPRLQIRH